MRAVSRKRRSSCSSIQAGLLSVSSTLVLPVVGIDLQQVESSSDRASAAARPGVASRGTSSRARDSASSETEVEGLIVPTASSTTLSFDSRVGSARGRIALRETSCAVGIDFQAFDFLHRRVVDAREGNAVAHRATTSSRSCVPFLPARRTRPRRSGSDPAPSVVSARSSPRLDVDDEQILVADEADVAAARREPRIGFVAVGLRQPAHRVGLRAVRS